MRDQREDVSDERTRARLLELGRAGVGGFVREDDGLLVRELPRTRLDELVRGETIPWRRAMEIVHDLARALEACETRGLFPGPMTPSQIGIEPSGVFVAELLVMSLLGKTTPHGGALPSGPSPRWTPPEQLDGAPWDNAANRYVLGLVAYRLIGGGLPFGGAGLRADLRERGAEGAAPFPDAIAEQLEPGVQSFVLSLLAARASGRPVSATAIVRRARELLGKRRSRSAPTPTASPTPAPSAKTPSRRMSRLWAVLPIAAGILLASGLLWASREPEEEPRPSLAAWKLESSAAESCGACHAREVSEWKRSVMAHAAKSPLYGSLESLVEEQIGRSSDCPEGAGVLRRAGANACFDRTTGLRATAAGGEHWCVNCHAPAENVSPEVPAWNAQFRNDAQRPLEDLLGPAGLEGVGCVACHQVSSVHAHRGDEGNPIWTSTTTGRTFSMRPDDPNVSNSAYRFDTALLTGDFIRHARVPDDVRAHLKSSELCGACHDVRLFGTDVIGVRDRGEHFKRLRNAYSEWATWAGSERRAGRTPATCQNCHMSRYPGVCVFDAAAAGDGGCPKGTRFERHAPGDALPGPSGGASHYFTSVDIPMTPDFPEIFATDSTLDAFGMPMGLEARRAMLLQHTFRFALGDSKRTGRSLEIPIEIENIGAGHRVPAGFSQEREIWVELVVRDGRGESVYEVGGVSSDDEDLHDKRFLRVNTDSTELDPQGRPIGLFGADVADGPDAPRWSPNPARGGTVFRGRGLINFQNGFLRCVRCIGFIDENGKCQAGFEQGRTRAGRFADGDYDSDTGECRSNLSNGEELFETYYPVGALDADRGIARAPDAIIDTRSAPPGVPVLYTYQLDAGAHPPPFAVSARLRFRPFPPFLVKAFADYEAAMAARGKRPSGPQVTRGMLARLRIVDLAKVETTIP